LFSLFFLFELVIGLLLVRSVDCNRRSISIAKEHISLVPHIKTC
jgi:hypothetical protein